MIETRYPGVYITEVPTNAKPIDGVSTSTSGLTGATALERVAHHPTFADHALAAGRLASSDTDFKYTSVQRYLVFVEHSIDNALQFAAFEPNGEKLWANVRTAVTDFLYDQWHNGSLMGTKPEEAFFVKCDRSTMTQNDLDNGRLVMLVGIATTKPAEFVILRFTVQTGSTPA